MLLRNENNLTHLNCELSAKLFVKYYVTGNVGDPAKKNKRSGKKAAKTSGFFSTLQSGGWNVLTNGERNAKR